MNFARLKDPALILARIAAARLFVGTLPKRKELLTLVDVELLRFNHEVMKAFSDLTKHDEPWERAAAVCGVTGMGALAFRAHNLLTGGRLRGFATREEALAWLLEQQLLLKK